MNSYPGPLHEAFSPAGEAGGEQRREDGEAAAEMLLDWVLSRAPHRPLSISLTHAHSCTHTALRASPRSTFMGQRMGALI